MNQATNNAGARVISPIQKRIFRTMAFTTVVAVVATLPFASWRVTAGVLLGGLLSLLNHHWLTRSAAAALSVLAHGAKPRIGLAQYVLRYAVVVIVVFGAYQLNLVSLPATIAGLCTFVPALFVEAFRELYSIILHREETT